VYIQFEDMVEIFIRSAFRRIWRQKKDFNLIFMFFQPRSYDFPVMDTQIVQNQEYLAVRFRDQTAQKAPSEPVFIQPTTGKRHTKSSMQTPNENLTATSEQPGQAETPQTEQPQADTPGQGQDADTPPRENPAPEIADTPPLPKLINRRRRKKRKNKPSNRTNQRRENLTPRKKTRPVSNGAADSLQPLTLK